MCGIYCLLLKSKNHINSDICNLKEIDRILKNRGPNQTSKVNFGNLLFAGYVLWQQGDEICKQPYETENIILLLNGDILNIDHIKQPKESDTKWLADVLNACRNDEDIIEVLKKLEGPYSIIFFIKEKNLLYFARDSMGRNSLLIENNVDKLNILSTSYFNELDTGNLIELPPIGLYKINLNTFSWTIYPWLNIINEEILNIQQILGITFELEKSIDPKWLLQDILKDATYNFYDIYQMKSISSNISFDEFLIDSALNQELEQFSNLLNNSVRERVQKTSLYCSNCITKRLNCPHSKIAILFSGGIDCTILSIIVDKYTDERDSIDLINVAFENVKSTNINWNVPDRISAMESFAELQRICPTRCWKFVEVNVTRNELEQNLNSHIKHLIYPLDSVLDESIGSAFWFASRGEGICNGESYKSPARVIIIGSGADELFGGYTRHKNAYRHCNGSVNDKVLQVYLELEKDWQRLPSRNLARDDRVIADNGKTSRAPFLEENVVKFVRNLKASQRCCFLLGEGVGDKLFLRLYGYQLGLKNASLLKKRAIQFGSKIANKKQNANDKSKYLDFNKNDEKVDTLSCRTEK